MKRLILAIALLLSGIYAAAAQFNGCPPGFCSGSGGIGGGGGGGFSPGAGGGGAPPATCSGTGLIFNVACNSQYVPIL